LETRRESEARRAPLDQGDGLMNRRMLARSFALCLILAAFGLGAIYAQTTASIESLRGEVTQALGAAPASVQVARTALLLTISRVDSPMNGSTHAGRNAEAEKIAAAISPSLKGLPDAAKLLTINVDYIQREAANGKDKLIDRIEFRRNVDGAFTLHIT
jgi:hypothetical protein